MKLTLATAAVLVASFAGGAYADTSAVEFQGMMKPFYSDADMKTMRSDEEIKNALMGMKPEDRDAMSTACSTPDAAHKQFCDTMIRAMGDL